MPILRQSRHSSGITAKGRPSWRMSAVPTVGPYATVPVFRCGPGFRRAFVSGLFASEARRLGVGPAEFPGSRVCGNRPQTPSPYLSAGERDDARAEAWKTFRGFYGVNPAGLPHVAAFLHVCAVWCGTDPEAVRRRGTPRTGFRNSRADDTGSAHHARRHRPSPSPPADCGEHPEWPNRARACVSGPNVLRLSHVRPGGGWGPSGCRRKERRGGGWWGGTGPVRPSPRGSAVSGVAGARHANPRCSKGLARTTYSSETGAKCAHGSEMPFPVGRFVGRWRPWTPGEEFG